MTARFEQRVPAILWAIAAVWLLVVAAATAVTLSTPSDTASRLGTLAMLGACGIPGVAFWRFAASHRMLRVEVADDGSLEIVWRSPLRTERRHVANGDVFPAGVVQQTTPHGEQHFVGRVILSDGTAIDLAQSSDRDDIETVVSRFNAVAGRRPFR